ncbi:MAG: type II secretion system protein [Candidatus Omnitrophica bacterium]|nr:type II secretion system protein [Candidatus Omnitrophota bacterium]
MGQKKGFTMLELIIVAIIVGILSTLAFVNHILTMELTLDKDAASALKVLRAAEMAYRSDMGTYYPSAGSDSTIATINANLKVLLSAAGNRPWNYTVWSTGCVSATRNGGDGRSWHFEIDDADDTPDAGAGCP